MAQTGYTPIKIYASTTAAAVPSAGNLDNTNGAELAINITDGKLFYKDNLGAVQTLASKSDVTTISFGTTGLTPSTATGGAITVAGTLTTANGGTGLTTFTGANNALYSTSASALTAGTLPVAAGGTGATSQTAYAVLCGGTTSTGAYQSIASVGTAGQVLTSNGAGALPTFQAAGGGFAAGTRMIFAQDAAPTGWTKDTTNYNNHALRVVTGTAGTTGGTVDFTTAFASQTPSGSVSVSVSGSVGNTTLGVGEIPSHNHQLPMFSGSCGTSPWANATSPYYNANTTSTGGGGAHGHSFSGSGSGSFSGNAINLAVKYLNVITATKN